MANELISIERLENFHDDMTVDAHILKRSTAYAVDDKVNKGLIYLKCTQAGTTASTTLSLTNVSVGDALIDGGAEWEVISVNGVPAGGGGTASGIAIWATNKIYKVNDMVLYEDVMYKCNTQHTSTTFSADSSNWDFVYSNVQDWKSNTYYKEGNIFIYDGEIYKVLVGFTSGSTFDNIQILDEYTVSGGETIIPYVQGTEISIGDIVSYNGNTYEALYDFTCGEEFTLYAIEEYVPKQLTAIQEQEIINHFLPNVIGNGNIVIEDSTPIGTIISFMGTQTPDCYLICNGQTYNIVDYSELAEFIKTQFGSYDYFGGDGITTFAVPDLRGEFLRGSGTNSHTNTNLNQLEGSGANVGEHQESTSFANANFSIGNNILQGFGFSGYNGMNYPDNYILTRKYVTCNSSESGEYIEDLPATFTSRPTNTSVLYCIKYKMSTRIDSGGGSSEGGTIDEWATSTDYKTGNFVVYENILYKCLADHTSGIFNTDYNNGKWVEIGETATTAQIEALFI